MGQHILDPFASGAWLVQVGPVASPQPVAAVTAVNNALEARMKWITLNPFWCMATSMTDAFHLFPISPKRKNDKINPLCA